MRTSPKCFLVQKILDMGYCTGPGCDNICSAARILPSSAPNVRSAFTGAKQRLSRD